MVTADSYLYKSVRFSVADEREIMCFLGVKNRWEGNIGIQRMEWWGGAVSYLWVCDRSQVFCAYSICGIEASSLFPRLLLICVQCLYVEGIWNTWDSRVTVAKIPASVMISCYKLAISSKLDFLFVWTDTW